MNKPMTVEETYRKAMSEARPDGFEVAWTSRDTWPIDQDGMTWVRLYCTDDKKALEYFNDLVVTLRNQVERMKKMAEELLKG